MAHMTVCRLCSTTEHTVDMFHHQLNNGEQLRFSILLATGIQIKEDDVVSKMVCLGCCQLVLKLFKYRTNSLANDKVLKERFGQPYTPPITDRDDLLRIVTEILNKLDLLSNSPDLLNFFIKAELIDQPCSDASNQPSVSLTGDNVQDLYLPSTRFDDNYILPSMKGTCNATEDETDVLEVVRVTEKAVSPIELRGTSDQPIELPNFSQTIKICEKVLPTQDTAVQPSNLPTFIQTIESGVKDASKQCECVPKVKHKHPSVQKLFETYKNIALPENVFNSDISPVISLDSAEVSEWYEDQLSALKQKLPNISINKVPHSSNCKVSSSPLSSSEHSAISLIIHSDIIPSEHTAVTASDEHSAVTAPEEHSAVTASDEHRTVTASEEHSAVTASDEHRAVTASEEHSAVTASDEHSAVTEAGEHSAVTASEYCIESLASNKPKTNRNYRRIISSSDSDGEDIDHSWNYNNQKENGISQINLMTSNLPATNQRAPPEKTITSNKPKQKKRRLCYTKRKSMFFLESDDIDEVIPEKKKRVYYNKNAIRTRSKVDLPKEYPSNKKEQKNLLTSSLELTPVVPPSELPTGKTLDTFLCPICNKLYDTKIELVNHKRTHLMCKFCGKNMGNLELLNKHQNETCFTNIVNNQPFIKLRKVDSTPSVVKNYAKAFLKPCMDKQPVSTTNFISNEYIDYSELGLNIEKAEGPIRSSDKLFIELEESIVNQYFTLLEEFEKNGDSSGEQITENNNHNPEVVCITDESGDEIEWITVNNTISSSQQSQNAAVTLSSNNQRDRELHKPICSSILSSQTNLSENEKLRDLFKKYYYSNSSEKWENSSQTFTTVPSTNSNLKLQNMFGELFLHRIPVYLKSQPNLSVAFRKDVLTSEAPSLVYNWTHKKVFDIEKCITNLIPRNMLPKSNPVIPNNPLKQPNVAPYMPNFLQSSNVATTKEISAQSGYGIPLTPVQNWNNICPPAMFAYENGTSYNNINQQQPKNFQHGLEVPKLSVAPSAGYQVPAVSLNNTTVTLGGNQDHIYYDQPEQFFYNNNNVNVNNYFMFSDNIQPTQYQTPSISNNVPHLNNIRAIPPPSYAQHLQKCETERVHQKYNLVPTNPNVQNSTGTLRVRNIKDLY